MGKHKHWSITFAITVVAITVPLLLYYFFYVEGHRNALTARHLRAVNEVGRQLDDRFDQLVNVAKWNAGADRGTSGGSEPAKVETNVPAIAKSGQGDGGVSQATATPSPTSTLDFTELLSVCPSSGFADAAKWNSDIEEGVSNVKLSDLHIALSRGLDARQRVGCVYNNADVGSRLEARAENAREEITEHLNHLTYALARFAGADVRVIQAVVNVIESETVTSNLKAYDDAGYTDDITYLNALRGYMFAEWNKLPDVSTTEQPATDTSTAEKRAKVVQMVSQSRDKLGFDYQTEPLDSPREPVLGEITDLLLPIQLMLYAAQTQDGSSDKLCRQVLNPEAEKKFKAISEAEADDVKAQAITDFSTAIQVDLEGEIEPCALRELQEASSLTSDWFNSLMIIYQEAEIGSPLESAADQATTILKGISPLFDSDLRGGAGVPTLRPGQELAAYLNLASRQSVEDILAGADPGGFQAPRDAGQQRAEQDIDDREVGKALASDDKQVVKPVVLIESSILTLQDSMRKTPWFRNLVVREREEETKESADTENCEPVQSFKEKDIYVEICSDADAKNINTFRVPLADWIDEELIPVDKVLIATEDGRVVYASGRDATSFSNVKYLFANSGASGSRNNLNGQLENATADDLKKVLAAAGNFASFDASQASIKASAHSWVQEVEVGLSNYLAYSQPYQVPLQSLGSSDGNNTAGKNQVWHLIGLVETSRFDRETLRPNMVFLGTASAVLVLGLLAWPYLQIRFVSSRKPVRSYQLVALVLSVLGGAAVVTLAISVYFTLRAEKGQVEELAEWVSQSLTGELMLELQETTEDVDVTVVKALGGHVSLAENSLFPQGGLLSSGIGGADVRLGGETTAIKGGDRNKRTRPDQWPYRCLHRFSLRGASAFATPLIINGPKRRGQSSSSYYLYSDGVSDPVRIRRVDPDSKEAQFVCSPEDDTFDTSDGKYRGLLSKYPSFELAWLMDPYGDHVGYHVSSRQALVARGNLSHRGYFKRAQTGLVSELVSPKRGVADTAIADESSAGGILNGLPIVLERIRTLDTGWLVTSAAFPIESDLLTAKFNDLGQLYAHKDSCVDPQYGLSQTAACLPEREQGHLPSPGEIGPMPSLAADNAPFVLAMTKKIQTFRAPILPAGFGFAVIRDRDGDESLYGRAHRAGDVIYHSDENRALIENLFNETDQNRRLRAAVDGRRQERLSVTYRGQDHFLYTSPIPSLPWSIVVFYDLELLHTKVFETGITAYINATLLGVFILIVIFFLQAAFGRKAWHWLWPQARGVRTYASLSILLSALGFAVMTIFMVTPDVRGWLLLVSLPIITLACVILTLNMNLPAAQKSVEADKGGSRKAYTAMLFVVVLNLGVVPTLALFFDSYEHQKERHNRYDLRHALESALTRDAALSSDMRRMLPNYFESTFSVPMQLTAAQFARGCHHPFVAFHKVARVGEDSEVTTVERRCLKPRLSTPKFERRDVGTYSSRIAELFDGRVSSFVATLISGYSSMSAALQVSATDVSGDTDWQFKGGGEGSQGGLLLARFKPGSHTETDYVGAWAPYDRIETEVHSSVVATTLKTIFELLLILLPLVGLYGLIRSVAKSAFALNVHDQQSAVRKPLNTNALASRMVVIRPSDKDIQSVHKAFGSAASVLKVDLSHGSSCDAAINAVATETFKAIILDNLADCLPELKKRQGALNSLEKILQDPHASKLPILLVSPVDVVPWLNRVRHAANQAGDSPKEASNADKLDVTMEGVSRWATVLSAFETVWGTSPATPAAAVQVPHHPSYIREWKLLTPHEKLAAIQLANGNIINLNDSGPLEVLLDRGLAVRVPQPCLVSESFAAFVRSAERDETVRQWEDAGPTTAWSVLRVPFFALLALSAVFLAYTGQEAIQVMAALLATGTAGTPIVMRVLGWMDLNRSTS